MISLTLLVLIPGERSVGAHFMGNFPPAGLDVVTAPVGNRIPAVCPQSVLLVQVSRVVVCTKGLLFWGVRFAFGAKMPSSALATVTCNSRDKWK